VWWDVVFCRGFCEIACAKRGVLRGNRGAFVVNCVAKRGSKSALKNGTGFFDKGRFILSGRWKLEAFDV
jgi:hypothetical protein